MPITVVSDVDAIVQLAAKLRSENPSTSKEVAASAALRTFYGLCPTDGIWGGSDAALCTGYAGHDENVDLFDRIASDVAARLP
jgi:hypothetical protein